MLALIGIVVIFAMVFGGYALAGGHLEIILEALPHEMIVIGGAGVGAFLLSNDWAAVKAALKDLGKVFKGRKWQPADYRDLLALLFDLVRLARNDPVALEEHVESPANSAIFQRYPKISADAGVVDLICDTLRAASMNYDDPHQVEEVLDKRMQEAHHHALHGSHAWQSMADAIPAIGIVAAVLGIIKTMGAIDQPPAVLGAMIGGALVGTFLGIFLAYGFIGPMAARIKAVVNEDHCFYHLIREVLVANLHRHSPSICIEVGRQNTPSRVRPSFSDVELVLRQLKVDAAA
jgi:chemotaxis protein MotA